MTSWPHFLSLVIDPQILNTRIDQDESQQAAVSADADESLFIVAGPGSGKTTVLTLRLLKLVFVDDVDPQAILATTFTKKAATELRSRILGWGNRIRHALLTDTANVLSPELEDRLHRLDLNRITTGTLDSIAEQVLSDFREPGTQPPIPLDEFVANALMLRSGLWAHGRYRNTDLKDYVQHIRNSNWAPKQKDLLNTCREIRDRFLHDQVDVDAFEQGTIADHAGVSVLRGVIEDYAAELADNLVLDFSALEQELLDRLNKEILNRFVDDIQIVLVDEYQDTNLLQERIYFALGTAAVTKGGSIAVVGDDDQSLYRFRGATVELFADFQQRLLDQCGIEPRPIYLRSNYRSTRNIVDWYSRFVDLDPQYAPSRVGSKPPLLASRVGTYENHPILGMFRPNINVLAHDLVGFIDGVFNGPGVVVEYGNQQLRISKDPNSGAVGDCAVLCSSPREYGASGQDRFPRTLRVELARLPNSIEVFNPRGQELNDVTEVQQLCGLMLECIDPHAQVQGDMNLPGGIADVLNGWRSLAQDYVSSNPPAPGTRSHGSLDRFVRAWQQRDPQGSGRWPREAPLMQLLYQLITWIPPFQEDPEGLIYLEAITRTITQSAPFAYDSTVHRDPPRAERSVKAILWNIFEPLASGAIDIDEDLIELLPRDRLQIMSIHQAKGLEFPLVIVDVGSDFKSNNWMQAFKRFPRGGSHAHNLEDALRPFSPLNAPSRSARDRAFDDLVRLYFVAFSRPQDVIMLVGLGDHSDGPKPNIMNVAAGWTRDEQRHWDDLPNLIYL